MAQGAEPDEAAASGACGRGGVRACVWACACIVVIVVIVIVLGCMYLLNFVYVLSHLIMTSKKIRDDS